MVWPILVSSKQKLDRRLVNTFRGYVLPLITARMAKRLNPITDRVYAAETMYTNLNEAFGKRDS